MRSWYLSDEPVHLRKIASALTALIHIEGMKIKVHALILGNIAPLSGCESKNSKALEITTTRNSLYLPHVCRCMYPDFVTC